MSDREILAQFGNSVVDDIAQRHIAEGQKASGDFLRMLRAEASDTRLLVIDGAGYGFAQESGRGPSGGSGTGQSLVDRLLAWMPFKGIRATPYIRKDGSQQSQEKADESLAFVMARKIHESGTLLYRKGGKSGVISGPINPQRVGALVEVFAERYSARALSDIKTLFAA